MAIMKNSPKALWKISSSVASGMLKRLLLCPNYTWVYKPILKKKYCCCYYFHPFYDKLYCLAYVSEQPKCIVLQTVVQVTDYFLVNK